MKNNIKELKPWLLLWGTQSISALGSAMTSYALVLKLFLESGSALKTAMLSICSYAPYVLMSIFAGALSDRWDKKKTMLICDTVAALSTAVMLVLDKNGQLMPWHLYLINALNGLMNTVQQPASEVAATLLIPKAHYQRTSALRSFSQSLTSILTPVAATALFSLAGLEAVAAVDILSFMAAFITLLFFIKLPETEKTDKAAESLISGVASGLRWLREHKLVLKLIFFLASINLVASAYEALLPAMILPRTNGGKNVLGLVNTCVGLATVAGSMLAMVLPAPKNRVRAICLALLFSMSTENFMLAFGRSPVVWCAAAVMGWLFIPYMGANLDVILRSEIPSDMQGRVYSCRNTLQFFTIPIGKLLAGILEDNAAEPFMAKQQGSLLNLLFGSGKGSGAALMYLILGAAGVTVCLIYSALLRNEKWDKN